MRSRGSEQKIAFNVVCENRAQNQVTTHKYYANVYASPDLDCNRRITIFMRIELLKTNFYARLANGLAHFLRESSQRLIILNANIINREANIKEEQFGFRSSVKSAYIIS